MTDAPTAPRPPVVCLIGPTRYRDAYRQAEAQLTCLGYVVLSPGLFSGDALLDSLTPDFLPTLTRQKVDMADQVVVVGGEALADEGTHAAIEYAIQEGKTLGNWMTGIPAADLHAADLSSDEPPTEDAPAPTLPDSAPRPERPDDLEDTLREVQAMMSHAARAAAEATGQVDALLLSRSTRAKSVTVPKATLAGIREHLVVTTRTLLEQAAPLLTQATESTQFDDEVGR